MTLMKGILVYTSILLGLMFAIGFILVAIMYFVPSVSILGHQFRYVTTSELVYYVTGSNPSNMDHIKAIDSSVLQNAEVLVINANNSDLKINIMDGSGSTKSWPLETSFKTKIIGFIKEKQDVTQPTFEVAGEKKVLDGDDFSSNVITWDVLEPKGLFINRETYMEIRLRRDTLNKYKKIIINNKDGDVEISPKLDFVKNGENTSIPAEDNVFFTFKELEVKSGSGKIILDNVNITDKLSIKKSGGSFTLDTDINGKVDLDVSRGKYYLNDINCNKSLEQGELTIRSLNSDIKIDKVNANVTVNANMGLLRIGEVVGDFSSDAYSDSKNDIACDISVRSIGGLVSIVNKTGLIDIGQVSTLQKNLLSANVTDTTFPTKDVEINNKSGKLTINNCFANYVDIKNTSGKVNLKGCASNLVLSTTYGNVNVEFYNDSTTSDGQNLINKMKSSMSNILATKNAAITFKNCVGKMVAECEGSGKLNADFDNMYSNSTLKSKYGTINVVVPTDYKFWLNWTCGSSKKANINVINYQGDEYKTSTDFPASEIQIKNAENYLSIANAVEGSPKLLVKASSGYVNVSAENFLTE